MKRNKKRLIQLVIVLFVAFTLIIIKNQSASWRAKFLPQKSNKPFSLLKKEEITELLITKDKTTSLYKKGEFWFTKKDNNEFRADEERINKIVESLINLKKGDIVSSNKNKHQDLGINKQKIEIKIPGKSYVIYIGNTSGMSNNFVRIDNENEVFTSAGFEEVFTSDDYRDLLLHLVNHEAKVTSIEIYFDDKKTVLSKKGNAWKIGNKSVKKDRVDFFINDLKTLKAKDIFKKPENYQPVDLEVSITVKESNQEKNIRFYYGDEENYSANITTSNFDYTIVSAYVASLKKEEKDFLE